MRKIIVSGFMLLPVAVCALALDEKTRSNTLAREEISAGWILLFDGETTFGWKTEGSVDAKDGALAIGGEGAGAAISTTEFGELEMRFECRARAPADRLPQLTLKAGRPGLGSEAALSLPRSGGGEDGWAACALRFAADAASQEIRYRLSAPGESTEGKISGNVISRVSLGFKAPAGCALSLRGVKLRPLGLEPIFNGKDLDGWKPIPGEKHRSRFTVTPKGELNIKDGRGDLQTEGEWADFVLQLDVISNGKHLNSGVFFRCVPGKHWSGYESQIRNQWVGDDRARPVDFGTGGIYRLQPARRVVPSDGEWFTKTIIAHGSHIAVWVDGYPVSDHIDTRPPADSARGGLKLSKGPISLQGHDPTTDLSFRNIRLAELP